MSNLDIDIKNLNLSHKSFSFTVHEFASKQNDDGQVLGTFSGAMATEDLDRGNDIIAAGAFESSLERYKKANRNIHLFYQHDTSKFPLGIIPIKSVIKDGKNWNIKGELNLDTQRGRDAYSLLKQRALSDLSIGFTILEEDFKDNTRIIKKLELWEVSIVSEPMNPKAVINEIKAATTFYDLPLAPEDREWDSDAAIARVRKETDSEDAPSSRYRNAFFWFDSDDQDNFGAYKLAYADVVEGKLMAIPRGIFAAAAAMAGARGGVDIPEKDRARVISHINRYYKKMDRESPLKSKDLEIDKECKYQIEDVLTLSSKKEFEEILRESGLFSRKAAVYLGSCFEPKQSESDKISEVKSALVELKSLVEQI